MVIQCTFQFLIIKFSKRNDVRDLNNEHAYSNKGLAANPQKNRPLQDRRKRGTRLWQMVPINCWLVDEQAPGIVRQPCYVLCITNEAGSKTTPPSFTLFVTRYRFLLFCAQWQAWKLSMFKDAKDLSLRTAVPKPLA